MKELYAALGKVSEKVAYIQKKDRNDQQRYTYLSDAVVVEKVATAMREEGLVSLPPIMVEHENVFKVPTKNGRVMEVTRVRVQFTIAHIETGETIAGSMEGYGSDIGDKGLNCALTSARKYFYIQTFNIASGDDPEQYHLIGDGPDIRPMQDQLFAMLTGGLGVPPEEARSMVGASSSSIDLLQDTINKTNEKIKGRKVQ